jgi:hypothetical protein
VTKTSCRHCKTQSASRSWSLICGRRIDKPFAPISPTPFISWTKVPCHPSCQMGGGLGEMPQPQKAERFHEVSLVEGCWHLLRAQEALTDRQIKHVEANLIQAMLSSEIPEYETLAHTLLAWRTEILAYFLFPYTNAFTEGTNTKFKLLKRIRYGIPSFQKLRNRILSFK